ncbi:hypothetical protein PPL_05257 [Heterostelium album PN500]|uniref:Uncharacterized protein n=1 Tax=Heterostelium pallidum (strain ATCC 26659 / Pp 5 / PN500) TaxID=670386 RepID=D3B9V7_HETP5|nr:hypothetical protein PPL_05257 [Heterostelium album PN500]EFA81811.1 hypothetical protein PPL_05257 [Heterostelium album PN500]|eukprot:XP_020433928.1 hypothetical protein PPL_05257 [Heterostelium album PN500]
MLIAATLAVDEISIQSYTKIYRKTKKDKKIYTLFDYFIFIYCDVIVILYRSMLQHN